MSKIVLMYIMWLCAFHVNDTDLFVLKVWFRELVMLDKIINCKIAYSNELVLISKQWHSQLRHSCYVVTCPYYALPN
ncbi:hypothetical protein CHOCRA_000118 [Candidatus Hodgkinia cicadicola]|nr:hypothetical protein CHOCRA_000118 [Candidatus Hodgkinia cicadicola]